MEQGFELGVWSGPVEQDFSGEGTPKTPLPESTRHQIEEALLDGVQVERLIEHFGDAAVETVASTDPNAFDVSLTGLEGLDRRDDA